MIYFEEKNVTFKNEPTSGYLHCFNASAYGNAFTAMPTPPEMRGLQVLRCRIMGQGTRACHQVYLSHRLH